MKPKKNHLAFSGQGNYKTKFNDPLRMPFGKFDFSKRICKLNSNDEPCAAEKP
jgi:hypothetical protein